MSEKAEDSEPGGSNATGRSLEKTDAGKSMGELTRIWETLAMGAGLVIGELIPSRFGNSGETEMKNIFVGNLSFRTTEDELRPLFEPFGEITRIQLMTDRDTGQSRGFAFVEMADEEAAAKAIAALNGTQLDGRTLNVSEARPKPTRERFRTGRGRW